MKKFKLSHKQSGFTFIGWVIVLFIGGFFAYLAMLLFPVIVGNFSMDALLKSLQNEPGIVEKSKAEINTLIFNRLQVNDIKGVSTDNFEIVRENADVIMVYADYENKIEFAKNIYILIVNNKQVELVRN